MGNVGVTSFYRENSHLMIVEAAAQSPMIAALSIF